MVCTAHRTDGAPCKGQALTGAKVCRVHGGSAPQVVAAAKRRIDAAADGVAFRLLTIALSKSKKTKTSDIIAACRDLLNRAGVVARPEDLAAAQDDGMVLWEEFVQIHRRRVPVTQE